jgi:ApbE superfamily uncharacterized protein (UPF0280 family)
MQAQRTLLSGQRWHFQHGPIDLVLGAYGDAGAVEAAHNAAWQRFEQVLPELVQELALLKRPIRHSDQVCPLQGPVARRMWRACHPFSADFITPMAAVAGAVAQEIIASYQSSGVHRAWVNNGGDIALHLSPGQSLRVGLYADVARLDAAQLKNKLLLDGQFSVSADMPVRGVATSGWRGRSFSLGIADSVTVLARTAAQADAAASVVANAVNLVDARVQRAPASSLKDHSDLGERLVTTDVPLLPPARVQQALQSGLETAQALRAAGLIHSAVLVCQQQTLTTHDTPRAEASQASHPEPHGLVLA